MHFLPPWLKIPANFHENPPPKKLPLPPAAPFGYPPPMQTADFLATARAILSQPTAPFHEDAVRAEIRKLLTGLPHVTLEEDDFGNLIATYQNGPAKPTLAFAAHMDHPGFVGRDFFGGVPASYLKKNKLKKKFGAFSMWDLPAFEVRAGKIYSRACDDLIGCAAIVAMFLELERTNAKGACFGLFTRAEEVGFIGAIHLAKSQRLPLDTLVISLETSSLKGGPVKLGAGVIIRIGDKTSVFDSAGSALLQNAAKQAELPHQRALMQGGTCEATAFPMYGYRAAAMCVALGNYHNCAPNEKIGSEFVGVSDAVGMAQLCVATVKGAAKAPDPLAALKKRLDQTVKDHRKYFRKLK
jgi:putative aminopeptidase FrvX